MLTIRRQAPIIFSELEAPKLQVHISCSTPDVSMGRDKAGRIVTSSLYLLDDPRSRSSISGKDKKFIPSPKRHTGSGTHPAPYSTLDPWSNTDQSPPFTAEIKNESRYASAALICHRKVHSDTANFTFVPAISMGINARRVGWARLSSMREKE